MHPINKTVSGYLILAGLMVGLGAVSSWSRAEEEPAKKQDSAATAVFDPATAAPGGKARFSAKGFAPNTKLTFGEADKTLRDFLFSGDTITDQTGALTQDVALPIYADHGELAFEVIDAAGNRTISTLTIAGTATRPFLFGPKVAIEGDDRFVHITGVGWTRGAPITVSDTDERIGRKVDLIVTDQCETAGCTRADSLDIVARLPQDDIPGQHRFTVSQGGEKSIDTVAEVPRSPDQEKLKDLKPHIFLIDPPASSRQIPSLAVRGDDWGPYEQRKQPRVWLVSKDNPPTQTELKVDRNYRDCVAKGCIMEPSEMFLRVEFTEGVKKLPAGQYLLYVLSENGLEAAQDFQLVDTPDLKSEKKPAIALSPSSGRVGTFVILTAGGFPRRTGTTITLDGVKIGGTPITDTDGVYDDVGFVIPAFIEKNKKPLALAPGVHTITVSAGGAAFSSAKFTILPLEETKKREDEDAKKKIEEERLKREREEQEKQERAEKEKNLAEVLEENKRLKKERDDLVKEKRELEKKKKDLDVREYTDEIQRLKKEKEEIEKQLKESLLETKQAIAEKDRHLKEERQKEKDDIKKPDSDTEKKKKSKKLLEENVRTVGKPCSKDLSITFQPGCISLMSSEPERPYAGRSCDSNLPKVWQEGCIEQQSSFIPETAGKPCMSDRAITFQPGCIPPKAKELEKPYAGKPCDQNLPRVWQEGCVEKNQPAQSASSTSMNTGCNPLIPAYSQSRCKK